MNYELQQRKAETRDRMLVFRKSTDERIWFLKRAKGPSVMSLWMFARALSKVFSGTVVEPPATARLIAARSDLLITLVCFLLALGANEIEAWDSSRSSLRSSMACVASRLSTTTSFESSFKAPCSSSDSNRRGKHRSKSALIALRIVSGILI